jgi:hypothetical protein
MYMLLINTIRWFMWRMESLALLTIMVSGIVIVATKVKASG